MKNYIIILLSLSTCGLLALQLSACQGGNQEGGTPAAIGAGDTNNIGDKTLRELGWISDTLSFISGADTVHLPTAKAIINAFIPAASGSTTNRDADYTSSVFFTFNDLIAVVTNFYDEDLTLNELKGLGFRAYLGKYDSTQPIIREHLDNDTGLYDRPTVLLQLMDRDNLQFKKLPDNSQYVTVNLGQLCPPKCPNSVPRTHDVFWKPLFN